MAIIGCGASGTAVAAQLLRQDFAGDLYLLEKGAKHSRGLAYATRQEEHLLNVASSKMSLFPDIPDHFSSWLKARYPQDSFEPESFFAKRSDYGLYIEENLTRFKGRYSLIAGEALDIVQKKESLEIGLASDERINCGAVILASGWGEKRRMEGTSDPYCLPEIMPEGRALILGCGLTAVDAALTLRARAFKGEIVMLSRRGVLPRSHLLNDLRENTELCASSLRESLRSVRELVKVRRTKGVSWHGVIDGLRDKTQAYWSALGASEKRTFLTHLRPYWDSFRHRLAPQVGAFLDSELEARTIKKNSGRVLKIESADGGKYKVTYLLRGSKTPLTEQFSFIIDATGAGNHAHSKLFENLVRRGLARNSIFNLGLECSSDFELLDANGAPNPRLLIIGPPARGSLWECTAMPEISRAAAAIAKKIKENYFKQKGNRP